MLASLTACNSNKPTMQNFIEANKAENLLQVYDSISILSNANGEMLVEYYLTKELHYEKWETWSMYLTDDISYIYDNGLYGRMLFVTKDGLSNDTNYRASRRNGVILSKDSLKEKIQSITETDDRITVTTNMDKKNLVKLVEQEDVYSFSAEYVMDAKTYSMISEKGIFTYDDGTTVDFTTECTYNVEMPEELKTFMEYTNQTEDLRTITLVFYAGTKNEKIESIQIPKGHIVNLAQPEGSNDSFSLYTDAAYTEPYVSNGDYTSDVILYIKWD